MVNKIYPNTQYGRVNPQILNEFENEFNLRFPEDYRNFLLIHNGGIPERTHFWIEKGKDGSSVQRFYGIHEGQKHLSLDTYLHNRRYFPHTMIPIGDDGTGNYICIGVAEYNFGIIYFVDHEYHSYEQPDSLIGINEVARTFTDFLDGLRETM